MGIPETEQTKTPSRFSGNDAIYYVHLLMLFTGLGLVYGLGVALIVIGAIGVVVSVASAFFVTGLSARISSK